MFGYESKRGWQKQIADEVIESLQNGEEPSEAWMEDTTTAFIEEHYDLGEMDEEMHDLLLEDLQEIIDQVQEKLIQKGHLPQPQPSEEEEEVENWWESGEEV